jgi:nifR3 family TIM-barrel protein
MSSIADILAGGRVILAPMAGVTEAPFRAICKRMGAALTYTEMVSATGLRYAPHSRTARKLLSLDPAEIPAAVQLFGADPHTMAEQAALVVERLGDDIALVDVNMGCPVAKVVAKGEGSALMRTPELAAEIVSAVVRAVDPLPVTVKFRKGWDEQSANAAEFASRMEQAGVAAVAVHGRTRGQQYKGEADWDVIARVKEAVGVPVIGSGDVFSAADVARMIQTTGVDAVMVARGAQGNPWIFSQANTLLETGVEPPSPSPAEKIAVAREHAAALCAFSGGHAVARMRKHVAWYATGTPGATRLRVRVNEVRTPEELDSLLAEYTDYLATRGQTRDEGSR